MGKNYILNSVVGLYSGLDYVKRVSIFPIILIVFVIMLSGCSMISNGRGGKYAPPGNTQNQNSVVNTELRQVENYQLSNGSVVNKYSSGVVHSSSVVKQNDNQIILCQNELDSLRVISPADYASRKADFDSLLRSASVYAQVRGDVNGKTKDTLDALYRYKTNQICMQIERQVLDGLIRRGENVK